jgi:hypothetical protein
MKKMRKRPFFTSPRWGEEEAHRVSDGKVRGSSYSAGKFAALTLPTPLALGPSLSRERER